MGVYAADAGRIDAKCVRAIIQMRTAIAGKGGRTRGGDTGSADPRSRPGTLWLDFRKARLSQYCGTKTISIGTGS